MLSRSLDQHLLLPRVAQTLESPTKQVQESLMAGNQHLRSRSEATPLLEGHLDLRVPRLFLLVRTGRCQVKVSPWADLLTLCPLDQTHSLLDPALTDNRTTALLMYDTTIDQPTTMGGLIVQSIPVTDQFLVGEPQREALVLWIAVSMAEEIRESMTIELCEHRPEMPEDLFSLLRDGSLGSPMILEMSGTPGTTASDSTTEDIQCRQVRSLGGYLQARASHRSTVDTNVMRHHLDIKHLTGKTLHRLGHLRICQHPRMVLQSILLEPL